MACPVAYITPKESYSKKAAFTSQSKATPGPRKKKTKIRKATKNNAYVSNLLDSTTNPDVPTLGKRFWSFIKSMKKDKVSISPLKKNGKGEAVHDGRKKALIRAI